MKKLVEKYQSIGTPEELLEFMNQYFSYGYFGKDGRVFLPTDMDFDDSWYLNYQLQNVDNILETRIGNCFDMVEFERAWFFSHGYQIKTFFEMVRVDYINSYPMHSFLVYQKDTSWFLFEFSDIKHRGIFKFFSLSELLECQCSNYVSILKENSISKKELESIVLKEYCKPQYGISAEVYLKHVLDEDIE